MAKKMNLNVMALVTQGIGLLLISVAIVLPSWLENPAGRNYYPYSRSWGLINVVGRTTRTHSHTWTIACNASSQMSVGVTCTSPLCVWYSQKCAAYRIILIISSVVLSIFCLAMAMIAGSILCSFRRSIAALRTSFAFSFVAGFLCLSAIIIYVVGMGQAFSLINSAGHYPVPQPGASFVIACVGTFLMFIGAILHCCRFKTLQREADFIADTRDMHRQAKEELGLS